MKGIDNLNTLKGVGEKSTALFQKCNLTTIEDLANYYPKYYDELKVPCTFLQMEEGTSCAVTASVHSRITIKRFGHLKICLMKVKDLEGTIREIAWFNSPFLVNVFHMNQQFVFVGQAVRRNGVLTLQHPKYYAPKEYQNVQNTLQPVYRLTEGLTNPFIRKCVKQLQEYFYAKEEYLLEEYRRKQQLISLGEAYQNIHFPQSQEMIIAARKRLVFHEMLRFFIWMDALKDQCERVDNPYHISPSSKVETLIASLPYQLTNAQKQTFSDILSDMTSDKVMNRLLQGDVGSGKTIVAILALLTVADAGYQGAIMAPTEVLATQHYELISSLLTPFGIRVGLLTGSTKGASRKLILKEIANQEVDILVGTHALIQDCVIYHNLALVITDEQHRFGVRQRSLFAQKGIAPHVLVMSATPIPRTLAMMLYGDMSISIMNELPATRLPIKCCVVGQSYRPSAYRFMQNEIKAGHQVYVICPMIGESETTEAENVISYSENLHDSLPDAQIACLHGKMSENDKNHIMKEYADGKIDILVSTTVIEVGINVPNATFMLIENAERFGLAQLHQLRGRVGRGDAQSYCVFMYGKDSSKTKERLEVLNQSNDGFFIAQEDLKLRGPGDFFGIRQSGEMDFAFTDIYQDAEIIQAANHYFKQCLQEGIDFMGYPDLCLNPEQLLSI